MTIESEQDLIGLKRICRVIALTLKEMSGHIRPGITTAELDAVGAAVLTRHGARSAPILTYDFPGHTCISVNYEAAHGIPGDRVLRAGDIVNLDVSAELDGYFGDHAASFPVGKVSKQAQRLMTCTKKALRKGIASAKAGRPINVIGRAFENTVRREGFKMIYELPGHGVGRALHEEPTIPGFYHPDMTTRLTEGMVITLEPFVSAGSPYIVEAEDGWTLMTADRSLAAQYEHTIVITRNEPIVLTTLS